MWILSPDFRNFPSSMKLVQDKTLEHEELGLKNSKQTNKQESMAPYSGEGRRAEK